MSFSQSKTCLAKIHEFPRDEEGSRRCVHQAWLHVAAGDPHSGAWFCGGNRVTLF